VQALFPADRLRSFCWGTDDGREVCEKENRANEKDYGSYAYMSRNLILDVNNSGKR
jgi:hypothetical protein